MDKIKTTEGDLIVRDARFRAGKLSTRFMERLLKRDLPPSPGRI